MLVQFYDRISWHITALIPNGLNPQIYPNYSNLNMLKDLKQPMNASHKLFGIFAIHSPESCPLNNTKSKEIFKEIHKKLKSNAVKFGVKEINGFYMSVLEHEWFILVQSNNAHDIEQLCIESGISSFNTVKIVPLTDYQDVLSRINQNQ